MFENYCLMYFKYTGIVNVIIPGLDRHANIRFKLQAFHVLSTVHTNTTPTVIIHLYMLQKPPFCNDNGYKV